MYERLSCTDNLMIYADIYGVSHDRILQTLELVGLKTAARKAASDLSKTIESVQICNLDIAGCNLAQVLLFYPCFRAATPF